MDLRRRSANTVLSTRGPATEAYASRKALRMLEPVISLGSIERRSAELVTGQTQENSRSDSLTSKPRAGAHALPRHFLLEQAAVRGWTRWPGRAGETGVLSGLVTWTFRDAQVRAALAGGCRGSGGRAGPCGDGRFATKAARAGRAEDGAMRARDPGHMRSLGARSGERVCGWEQAEAGAVSSSLGRNFH